jgi:hypothetical protein
MLSDAYQSFATEALSSMKLIKATSCIGNLATKLTRAEPDTNHDTCGPL